MESVWHCIRRHTGQTWPFTITDKDSINQRSSPEAPGDSGGAAETKRTTINHVPHETDFYGRAARGKAQTLEEDTVNTRKKERWLTVNFLAYVQNAVCILTLDVKANTPRLPWKMVAAAPAGTGSWPVLVGRQMALNSGQSCRPDTGAEVHHPGGKWPSTQPQLQWLQFTSKHIHMIKSPKVQTHFPLRICGRNSELFKVSIQSDQSGAILQRRMGKNYSL